MQLVFHSVDAGFFVEAWAGFDDHDVVTAFRQRMREQRTGRAGTDHAHIRAVDWRSVRCRG
ncbi:MAG: hypothetical protein J07HN6_00403 [Halonotius sp. J07HN6]|jgi:hypothetical protein|nr:MAG: hypothetical protein J07HN6_00403 [Halonotius sp. J07HN6]